MPRVRTLLLSEYASKRSFLGMPLRGLDMLPLRGLVTAALQCWSIVGHLLED